MLVFFTEFLSSFLSLCACLTIHYFSLSQDRTKTHTYNDKRFDMQKYGGVAGETQLSIFR